MPRKRCKTETIVANLRQDRDLCFGSSFGSKKQGLALQLVPLLVPSKPTFAAIRPLRRIAVMEIPRAISPAEASGRDFSLTKKACCSGSHERKPTRNRGPRIGHAV